MSCFNPLLAVDNGINPDTGKHSIKILNMSKYLNLENARSVFGKSLMMLPCGKCVACAQDYARTWQARIMCEAQYHAKKCFITLTYRDDVKPNKDDLRAFLKAVRNKYGEGIKFFACGELGSHTKRFHLHAILFGVDFMDDAQIVSKRGLNLVYNSPTLDLLWKHGFASLGTLDISSAGYVSKYCDKKKITRQDDGEFVIMSRGLGRKYFEDHREEIFNSDYLYFDGNKFKIPRYFLKLALNDEQFYLKCLAWDYQDRKRLVAQSFRYDKSRSVSHEEEGMQAANDVAVAKYEHEEAVRDVL